MDYKNERLGVRFVVPDNVTVRQQLAYYGAYGYEGVGRDRFVRMWNAALELIEGWECESHPDPKAIDLDTDTSPTTAQIVLWAGSEVSVHMANLEDVPKNS